MQNLIQVDQHTGRSAPYIMALKGHSVKLAFMALDFAAVAFMVGRVEQKRQRHLEDLFNLEGIRVDREGGVIRATTGVTENPVRVTYSPNCPMGST